ncbi:MAG: hypothetical protein ACRD1G_03570, partial [Acidimicrobiales bacterium]
MTLIREVGGVSSHAPINGSTLRDLATFVGVDLAMAFSCGDDAPPVGNVDRPFDLDADALAVIANWYELGWRVLDAVVSNLPAETEVTTTQLWPEHFDAATTIGLASGNRVNLGFSPGDTYE